MSRGQAQSLVERGLKLRRSIGHENRIALSLNSSAIVSLTFGEPYRAWQLSDEVKRIFENLQEKRGFGLACITLGRALRQLSKCEDEYKDIDCVQFLEEAIDNLKQAVLLFEQQVEEPIRRVEALSELGYTYADLANTLSVNLINTPAVDYKKLAIETLEKASELAAGKYYVWYVQNCVGLAHLYSLNQDYEKAELWLGRANEVLSLSDVQVSNRDHTGTTIGSIDGLYYQGGQIQLLLGHWALERDRSVCKLETLQENLVQALTHYIAATIHFSRFSKDCLNSNSDIFAEIFSHLHRFTIDDIRDAWKQVETTQNVSCSDEASRLTDFWENVLLVMVAK
jgi:tetratricopeptide (TPR) repeat protein